MASNGQYYPLWERNRALIIKAIIYGGGRIALSQEDFIRSGNRHSYSFRIEYSNGQSLKRGGSAVARDLQDILECDNSFYTVMAGKDVVIRMGNSFEIEIFVYGDRESEEDEVTVGAVITHSKFGDGTVKAIDRANIIANFDEKTVKLNYRFALGKGIIELKK